MALENQVTFAEVGNPKRVTQLTENTDVAGAYFLTEKVGETAAKKTSYATVESAVKSKVQSEYLQTLSVTPASDKTMSEKLTVGEFKKRDDKIVQLEQKSYRYAQLCPVAEMAQYNESVAQAFMYIKGVYLFNFTDKIYNVGRIIIENGNITALSLYMSNEVSTTTHGTLLNNHVAKLSDDVYLLSQDGIAVAIAELYIPELCNYSNTTMFSSYSLLDNNKLKNKDYHPAISSYFSENRNYMRTLNTVYNENTNFNIYNGRYINIDYKKFVTEHVDELYIVNADYENFYYCLSNIRFNDTACRIDINKVNKTTGIESICARFYLGKNKSNILGSVLKLEPYSTHNEYAYIALKDIDLITTVETSGVKAGSLNYISKSCALLSSSPIINEYLNYINTARTCVLLGENIVDIVKNKVGVFASNGIHDGIVSFEPNAIIETDSIKITTMSSVNTAITLRVNIEPSIFNSCKDGDIIRVAVRYKAENHTGTSINILPKNFVPQPTNMQNQSQSVGNVRVATVIDKYGYSVDINKIIVSDILKTYPVTLTFGVNGSNVGKYVEIVDVSISVTDESSLLFLSPRIYKTEQVGAIEVGAINSGVIAFEKQVKNNYSETYYDEVKCQKHTSDMIELKERVLAPTNGVYIYTNSNKLMLSVNGVVYELNKTLISSVL